ncbi:hypothetical protein JCM3766R1_002286 [Sporobolomyces carnicolor]
MNSRSPFGFASPLGPLHFSHPSRMTSFVVPLPSPSSLSPPSRGGTSSRIRSFFLLRSSIEEGGTIKSKLSSVTGKKNESDKLEVEIVECEGSTFTSSVEPQEIGTPSFPPPSYRNAIEEEDLYCQDVTVEEEERNRIVGQDRKMSDALKTWGF